MTNEPINKQYSSSSAPIGFVQQNPAPYTTRQFNTGSITVWVSEQLFYVEPRYVNTFIPTVLKIDRLGGRLKEIGMEEWLVDKTREELGRMERKLEQERRYSKMEAMNFSFLVGVVNLADIPRSQQEKGKPPKDKKILLLAQAVQLVCTINQRNIYKILKPVYLFYNPKDKQSLDDEQAIILLNISLIFQKGMYYSYTYHLLGQLKDEKRSSEPELNPQGKKQKQKQSPKRIDIKLTNKSSLEMDIKEKDSSSFNWAHFLQRELRGLHEKWRVPVIQGYVGKIEVYVNAQKFKITLISRRSKKNGGPSQYCTGFTKLTPEGRQYENSKYTGNFVQTQIILHVKKLYFSFIQIRGTVPLHWQHKYNYGIVSGVKFNNPIQKNYQDFLAHIKRIKSINNYDHVVLLNLLQKDSPNIESKLTQNYEYIVKKAQKQPGLHYKYYDIRYRCPGKNYSQFNKFINSQLRSVLLACGFSVLERTSTACLEKVHEQKGIVRVNCGTCVDRSNIVQSRIAAWQIVEMLRTLNIKITNMDPNLQFIENDTPFARLYRNMWADNGDAISEQYTGTNSMESAAVRMGKLSYLSTIDHGLTSLYRIVRKIRQEDDGKHRAVLYLSMEVSEGKQSQPGLTSRSTHSNVEMT